MRNKLAIAAIDCSITSTDCLCIDKILENNRSTTVRSTWSWYCHGGPRHYHWGRLPRGLPLCHQEYKIRLHLRPNQGGRLKEQSPASRPGLSLKGTVNTDHLKGQSNQVNEWITNLLTFLFIYVINK